MYKYTYKCDCCQAESEHLCTNDDINPPRLPPDWRRFHLEACDPTNDRYQTWEEELTHDLCPTCAEYFRNAMNDYKAAIAHFNNTQTNKTKPKAEKVV